jgi:hypothetical protein
MKFDETIIIPGVGHPNPKKKWKAINIKPFCKKHGSLKVVFEPMPIPFLVSLIHMILSFLQYGVCSLILKACVELSTLQEGKENHGHGVEAEVEMNIFIGI